MKLSLLVLTGFFATSSFSYGQEAKSELPILTDTVNAEESYSIEGIWELKSFHYYKDNKIIDSADLWAGYKQIKFFQNGYIMWTREVPRDSTEWYGYGTYEIKGDTLIERIEYGSHELMKRFAKEHVFIIRIDKNQYQQIDLNRFGMFVNSENYRRVKSNSPSEVK